MAINLFDSRGVPLDQQPGARPVPGPGHKHIEKMGADPTAMTPCADVAAVQALGIMQVISDPRTTLAQAVNALLSAELTDTASWELLIELAEQTGHKDMATEFTAALQNEQQHVQLVRGWLREAVLKEAT